MLDTWVLVLFLVAPPDKAAQLVGDRPLVMTSISGYPSKNACEAAGNEFKTQTGGKYLCSFGGLSEQFIKQGNIGSTPATSKKEFDWLWRVLRALPFDFDH